MHTRELILGQEEVNERQSGHRVRKRRQLVAGNVNLLQTCCTANIRWKRCQIIERCAQNSKLLPPAQHPVRGTHDEHILHAVAHQYIYACRHASGGSDDMVGCQCVYAG